MTAVLITGATGKQGGALIRNLLLRKAPFEILAVTRNPSSSPAQKLASLSTNIKLVEGDLDDPGAIFRNAQRLTTSPIWGAAIGNKAEETQGKALIDESIRQKVKFFVYSSVDRGGEERSFQNPTKIPHFIKKHNIEHHLVDRSKSGNMDWVVLRPVAFFENLTPDFFGKPLQLVATSDIGYFGAEAFLNPEKYKGRALSLAGDELTFEGMGLIFEQKTGRPLPMTFRPVCSLFMAMMKDMGYMFQWFRNEGYKADIPKLREIHPEMMDFSAWLKKESGFKK
ncbi:nmrA-like family protein [Aspergillus phoenicis ATCC 13157]|uniref:NmrA-like family protein n=1 Tax=Aspergillus phoenicis ATCC 13157 TaxID=1353007 RepID=A0A370PUP9_ASPPH|nr:nmrA-like family protein [Aspergillus phoenicis ATCC 13157]